MNRQRTNIRSRYYRCPSRPGTRPTPTHPRRIRTALALAVDLMPGALTAFTGLALVSIGISWM